MRGARRIRWASERSESEKPVKRRLPMKFANLIVFASLIFGASPASAQKEEIPKSISESVGGALGWAEKGFLGVAEAMPEDKYSYIPTQGNFDGVRSFGEQVKHVACAQFAFFNEIEGRLRRSTARRAARQRPRRKLN
jgi:hypothetical protein